MSSAELGYLVKKDVHNHAIVREVDPVRQRELWRSLVIGGLLVVVLLFSAWQHFELLRHGYRIEQMQQDRADEEAINQHLRLELETLKSPTRIERIAIERLGLAPPSRAETIVIQRVTPPPRPAKSVVASR